MWVQSSGRVSIASLGGSEDLSFLKPTRLHRSLLAPCSFFVQLLCFSFLSRWCGGGAVLQIPLFHTQSYIKVKAESQFTKGCVYNPPSWSLAAGIRPPSFEVIFLYLPPPPLQGRKSQRSYSPTSAPTRLKKPSPSFLPHHVTVSTSSKVVTPPFSSPTRTGEAATGDKSALKRCGCRTPQTNKTTAGVVGSIERGDKSLALFSPGKEYWAGRIAGSPRNSDSPTALTPRKKISPKGNVGQHVLGSKGGQKLRLGVPVSSLPSGDPLAMVLPGIQTNGSTHSSAWSTQASIFSSSSGSTLSPSPGVTRRYDLSPTGNMSPPRLGRALPGETMDGKVSKAHKNVRMGATSMSPTGMSSSRRAPRSRTSEPQAFNRTSGLAKRGESSSPMRRFKPRNHNKVRGGATSSNPASSSSRLGRAHHSLVPVEKHPNGKGSRTASVNTRKVSRA